MGGEGDLCWVRHSGGEGNLGGEGEPAVGAGRGASVEPVRVRWPASRGDGEPALPLLPKPLRTFSLERHLRRAATGDSALPLLSPRGDMPISTRMLCCTRSWCVGRISSRLPSWLAISWFCRDSRSPGGTSAAPSDSEECRLSRSSSMSIRWAISCVGECGL